MAKKEKQSLPSFLNFNRSISPSEGLIYGVRRQNAADGTQETVDVKIPVEVISRGVRGSISSYSNVYKGEKVESSENIAKQLDPKQANLQQVEVAYMPVGTERIAVEFSLVIQSNSLVPSGCNDTGFYDKVKALTDAYSQAGGYHHLAARYLWNVINGRTLWRNRFASDKKAKVECAGEVYHFNVDNVNLNRFDASEMPEGFETLAHKVGEALAGRTAPIFLTVEISGYVPKGAEVYPSQEFLPDAAKRSKDYGKVLSHVDVEFDGRKVRQATLHSQKIGNAIRVIDEWHGQIDEYGVTAIEAYGYVQSRNNAVRLPGDSADIYKMLKEIEAHTETVKSSADAACIPGDIHYMIAMLVRGGVFSGEAKS
ncbi:type I-F CRISPR-associated protein Csy3 [Sinorhizobium meliloti]|nr:type I-F CRISPR-associated protein Csy3 [Sinorhizobium meliloti]